MLTVNRHLCGKCTGVEVHHSNLIREYSLSLKMGLAANLWS